MKSISIHATLNTLVLLGLILAADTKAQNVLAPTAASIAVVNQTANWQVLEKAQGDIVRVNPAVDWSTYKRYEFAPASYQPVDLRKQLRPRDADKMRAFLDASLRSAYLKLPKVDGPALQVRPIITNFKRTSTLLNLISFAAIQMPASYGAASVRYELIDAQTGIEIGEIASTRKARPWNVYPWNLLQNFHATGQGSVLLKSSAKGLEKDTLRLAKRTPAPNVALAAYPN